MFLPGMQRYRNLTNTLIPINGKAFQFKEG